MDTADGAESCLQNPNQFSEGSAQCALQDLNIKGRNMLKPDFKLRNEGSIQLLTPITEAAHEWIEEHLLGDCRWFGMAVAIETNYADPILNGIKNDGLTIV